MIIERFLSMLNDDKSIHPDAGYAAAQSYDVGLRQHMMRVYNTMSMGLGITGLVAYFVANTGLWSFFANPMMSIVMLVGMFGFVLYGFRPSRLQNSSVSALRLTFYSFSAFLGAFFSVYFVAYSGASLARVFFITAGMFLAMSLYGYTTKRDLTGMRSFLIMGVWGLLIAMIVNFFLQSSMLQFVYSVIGVLIYTGLTAYDTQNMKRVYLSMGGNDAMTQKIAVYGALSLYMNFIMLFQFLMNLMNNR